MNNTNTNMKYLVSITSLTEGFDRYRESCYKLGEKIISLSVVFDRTETSLDFYNIKIDSSYPGNLSRFCFFPMGLDDDDMVIFTDSSDVIFQYKLPRLKKSIYVSPEYEFWGEDNWWKQHLDRFDFHELDGTPIYCMGTWAMPFRKVKELLQFIDKNKYRFDGWEMSDQILFNWWLLSQKSEVHPTLMTSLYNSYGKGYTKKEGNYFVNQDGKPYSIVHANGNTKDLLVKKIENEN